MTDDESLLEVHFHRNRVTRDQWDTFAPHRARVTQHIVDAAQSDQPTLCVLGAGNGNDIDLEVLAEHFEKITLVDLDRLALDHCLARIPADVAAKLETLPDVDLSVVLDCLASLSTEQTVTQETIARAGNPVTQPTLNTYDVVASTCLLTQMIDSIAKSLGPSHPQFADLVFALRDGHLRLVHRLTAANGTAVVFTDFVSSDTLPELATVTDQQLDPLLAGAISSGNFFTGANPGCWPIDLTTNSFAPAHATSNSLDLGVGRWALEPTQHVRLWPTKLDMTAKVRADVG